MCFLNHFKEVLMQGTLNNGLILTVVSSDRPGQAAAYCQLIHQHQPWILATRAPSLILDNSTKQSDSERPSCRRGDIHQAKGFKTCQNGSGSSLLCFSFYNQSQSSASFRI